MFSRWAYSSLRSLFMYCEVKTYTRNQIVYSQFDLAECMYIIQEGEFKTTVRVQYEETYQASPEEAAYEQFKKKKTSSRDIEFSILSRGEMFGVDELFDDGDVKRAHTIVCLSQAGLVLKISKKDAKAMIFSEPSAKAWLNAYLITRRAIQSKRIARIYNNTKKFKTLLMYTHSDVARSSSETNSKGDSSNSENKGFATARPLPNKTSEVLSEEIRSQKPEAAFRKRLFAPLQFVMKYDQKCLKEIPGQQWMKEQWLEKEGPILYKTVTLRDPEKTDGSPKSKFVHLPEKNTEENFTKSSLTSRLFNEHKGRNRLKLRGRESVFSKTAANSPGRSLMTKSSVDTKLSQQAQTTEGEYTNRISTLDESPKLAPERKPIRNSSSPSLLSAKFDHLTPLATQSNPKFQIKVHHASTPTSILDWQQFPSKNPSLAPSKTDLRLHNDILPLSALPNQNQSPTKTDLRSITGVLPLKTLPNQNQSPPKTELRSSTDLLKKTPLVKPTYPVNALERLSQMEALSKIRGKINQNALFLSKRKEQETKTMASGQMFYNSTISNRSGSLTSRDRCANNSPVNLLVREHPPRIEKPMGMHPRVIRTDSPFEVESTYRGALTSRASPINGYADFGSPEPKIIGLKHTLYNRSPGRVTVESLSLKISLRNNQNPQSPARIKVLQPIQKHSSG